MRRAVLLVSGLALGALLVPEIARGEGGVDAARAESLFAEGRRLMAAKDYAAACPKFAHSQALEPAPGTALNLATCYESAGKLASAWAAFRIARASAEAAGQQERATAAKKKISALEARLSRLTISVPSTARVTGLEVQCDDEPVADSEWGVAVPRDGGVHDIQAQAPGKKNWTGHVELRDHGQTLEVEVPTLEDVPVPHSDPPSAPPDPQAGAPSQGSVLAPPTRASLAPGPDLRARIQRPIALGLGGLGVAGLAFGVIAGLEARKSIDDARGACGPTAPACKAQSEAFGLRDTAVSWATASTIGFLAGGALIAAGAVLYVMAPSGRPAASLGLALAEGGAGVSLRRTF
jgi:hypothetical protein